MPFVIFLLYILIEIALFIWIGGMIGVGWTLLWVLGGFVVGLLMLRRGGEQSREWLQNASAGNPEKNIGKQLYWYIGGLLVILPGFFTDFLGAALVFPPTQSLVTAILSGLVPASVQTGFSVVTNLRSTNPNPDPNIIDGDAEEIRDIELPPRS